MSGVGAGNEAATYRGRGRLAIVAVLVLALAGAGVTREWATALRATGVGAAGAGQSSSLSGMSSFALALLLGGLRGPLVMILWSSSESQKADRNLEDFDTKVEWIRLLQPEFDTVHIFQIWNKAYNVSAQMASLANKYSAILDALDYAKKVDRERPGDINIVTAIGQVYSDKFGNAQEKVYYRQRVREESKPHANRGRRSDLDRPTTLDPMLDDSGHILPSLLVANRPRPANLPADAEWEDGSDLQYLRPYEPFKQGLSPQAIGYAYQKRAQVMQTAEGQRHTQLSDVVIDSRPALILRGWGEEEMERGRRAEVAAFGLPVPTEKLDLEHPTAALPLDAKAADPARAAMAHDDYVLAARVMHDAAEEYARHLKLFPQTLSTYQSHLDHVQALQALLTADDAYLQAVSTPPGKERDALLATAKSQYEATLGENLKLILHYYTDEQIVAKTFPPGVTRMNVEQLPTPQLLAIYSGVRAANAKLQSWEDMTKDDREEYEHYVDRALNRLTKLGGDAAAAAAVQG